MRPPASARLYLMPLVIFLLLVLAFPVVMGVFYSVSQVGFQNIRNPHFNGLVNFVAVLRDPNFWRAVRFSFSFGGITALLEVVLGLFLVVFLSPLLKARAWALSLLLMPLMAAPALIGLIYRLVLHEFAGPVPYYLWMWFGNSPAFLDENSAFYTLIVVEILQWTPFALLLMHVSYQGIAPEIREAAEMDGARSWGLFFHVELPMIKTAVFTALLVRFIDGFRVFDNVYVLTGGGAGGTTTSLPIYIYQTFFQQGDVGKALAASMILLLVSFMVYPLFRRKGHD